MPRLNITDEVAEQIREWNVSPERAGRWVRGLNEYTPVTEEQVARAIRRWKRGKGTFLVQAFVDDLATRARQRPERRPAPRPVAPEEQLPADHPALRPMWAAIAVRALNAGTEGHYSIVSRDTGAPSAKVLEAEGFIRGVVSGTWSLAPYRMPTFNIQRDLDPGVRRSSASVSAEDIRAALTKWLSEASDEALEGAVRTDISRSEWVVAEPVATEEESNHAIAA